jgi:hypothetical protein
MGQFTLSLDSHFCISGGVYMVWWFCEKRYLIVQEDGRFVYMRAWCWSGSGQTEDVYGFSTWTTLEDVQVDLRMKS